MDDGGRRSPCPAVPAETWLECDTSVVWGKIYRRLLVDISINIKLLSGKFRCLANTEVGNGP